MGKCKAMNPFNRLPALPQYVAPNLSARAIVLALVIAVHAAVLFAWSMQTGPKHEILHDMTVSFAMAAQTPRPSLTRLQNAAPVIAPLTEQILEHAPVTQPVAPVATPAAISAAPVDPAIVTTEPVYKAAYLNNPAPVYPMAARRMGLQGRVLLNVEVLANGICGQISIQKSSGYAMLDNAALDTVKTWRFLPASQSGRAVDKWFMIPVQFSLKDNA
jgi:protein TonB